MTLPTATLSADKFQVDKSQKIAVLCGGPSSEAEVSRRSGRNCLEALKRLGYSNSMLIEVDKTVAETLKAEFVEVAFIAVHGRYGEDGAIQGLLEVLEIPYTGSSVEAMALTMNKHIAKSLLREAGLPVLPWFKSTLEVSEVAACIEAYGLDYPLIIKPLSEGSSVGMSKVLAPKDLAAALEAARPYCDQIIVEPFTTGKDLTVGVLQTAGQCQATPILELRSQSKSGWYDYEAKYTPGLTQFILPAELSDDATRQVQQLAVQAHLALGCYGVSRVDFLFDMATNKAYILEVNTIPGMTATSDLPAQAEAMGLSYDALVETILQTASLQAQKRFTASKKGEAARAVL